MQAFNPLEHFTGREDIIELFRGFIQADTSRWAMMVDGLSGTGKTLLVDWFRDHELGAVPHAYIKLTQAFH